MPVRRTRADSRRLFPEVRLHEEILENPNVGTGKGGKAPCHATHADGAVPNPRNDEDDSPRPYHIGQASPRVLRKRRFADFRQIGVFQPFERPVVHAGKNFNRHVYVPRAAFAIRAVFSLRREVLPHFTPHKFHRRIPESNPIPVFLASVRPMRIASLKAVEPQEGGGCFASARPTRIASCRFGQRKRRLQLCLNTPHAECILM